LRIAFRCVFRNIETMPSSRTPADAAFLARRLARIAWPRPPSPPPRAWLVETCRAELEWAAAQWRWLAGDPDHRGGYGPHPSEAWRLPTRGPRRGL
jgi:hypothetical protein